MNNASHNGSPQQIPLLQLPFSNVAKTRYRCSTFWARSNRIVWVLNCLMQYILIVVSTMLDNAKSDAEPF